MLLWVDEVWLYYLLNEDDEIEKVVVCNGVVLGLLL